MSPRHIVLLTGVALLACAPSPPAGDAAADDTGSATTAPDEPSAAVETVRPGVEVLLADSLHLIEGRRVGLLTNHSAVTRDRESVIDLLHASPDVDLVALYGPEHGVRGGIEGGERIDDGVDEATGLPVFSLYGAVQRPTPEMLSDIDVLVFDMQDIGARPYTFIWTMAMAMEAAAEQGLPFVVLDRPNPITDAVEGPLMEMEMREVAQPITGYYPVPLRHGMTAGEVALYVNGEYDVGADLSVVPTEGWHGGQWFDETELPWIDPSPNIRTLEAALTYSGLVLLEATNLTVGRGTDAPFSTVGAPWLDTPALLERLGAYDLPGVRLSTTRYVPDGDGWVPFRGETVRAIAMDVTDRDTFRSVLTAFALMSEIRGMHPDRFEVTNEGMTQMLGSRWAREAFDGGEDPRGIVERWEDEVRDWMQVRDRYRLYPKARR